MKNLYKNRILLSCFLILFAWGSVAQEVIELNAHLSAEDKNSTIEEVIEYAEDGSISRMSMVTQPSMTAYLPDPEIATGTAVIVMPGGAMRFLSWVNEGTKVASWLNEKGIAAFILKYKLDTSEMQMGQGAMPPMRMSLTIDQFDQLENANANPSTDPHSVVVANNAGDDAMEAIRIIRERSQEWNIDKDKVGYLGFSAGGGVALNAVVRNSNIETMPNFIGSIYGPSIIDVVVPNPAPPLFLATAADHMNVAAGCLAVFTSWKKAGGEAEFHIYGKGRGAFGMTQQNLPSDSWIDSFYLWLQSGGF